VQDADDAAYRERPGEGDDPAPGGEHGKAGPPGQIHAPMAGQPRLGRWGEPAYHDRNPGHGPPPPSDRLDGRHHPVGGRARDEPEERQPDKAKAKVTTTHAVTLAVPRAPRKMLVEICGQPTGLWTAGRSCPGCAIYTARW